MEKQRQLLGTLQFQSLLSLCPSLHLLLSSLCLYLTCGNSPTAPVTEGQQCSRPCKGTQAATGIRLQHFCSSCTTWHKGELIPGEGGSLTHRTSKDSTLDLKEKNRLGNILGKIKSRVAWDLGNTGVYQKTLKNLKQFRETGKKASWLTCVTWKASNKLMTNKDLGNSQRKGKNH